MVPISGSTSRRRALAVLAAGATACGMGPVRAAPPRIAFDRFYKSFGVLGMEFSDELAGLEGRSVSLRGYMAPPLKAESDFFVLTREPLAICPFCQSDADWPLDIAVIYLRRPAGLAPAGARLLVSGRLDLGSWTDPRTGFVSQIRVREAEAEA